MAAQDNLQSTLIYDFTKPGYGDNDYFSIDMYPLMSDLWTGLAIVSVYLLLVLAAGPKIMEKKPPFQLKGPMILYNIFIVAFSTWFVVKSIRISYGYFFAGHCYPETLPREVQSELTFLSWCYFMTKIIELSDTVFFVLRKKTNQVSLLHVYHHTNMPIMTWLCIKCAPASELQVVIQGNTFVHIIMYSYYLLAALGPSVQKYLFWKKYLTSLQIAQFFIIIGYNGMCIFLPGCQSTKIINIIVIANTASFLILFLSFYSKSYTKKIKS